MLDWVREELLDERLISVDDVDLLSVTDDVEEAVSLVVDCYERRCAETPARAV
jgi:predicted Rossmann-fold nucleotide-binding protein